MSRATTTPPAGPRAAQAAATRDALLDAAEQLFAEHGVRAVGIRQISQAAHQGNNTAVSYHFGSKNGLLRAIVRRHAEVIEHHTRAMLDYIHGSTELRDWVACAVVPVTAHLDELGQPSWYARFIAHLTADPDLRKIANDEFNDVSGALSARRQEGLLRCVPDLDAATRTERAAMTRHLINHVTAEREADLAANRPTPRATWTEAATGLIDAIVAVWHAPITTIKRT